MLALERMMNAQRNRGMYLRVGERLAEIRKSRIVTSQQGTNGQGMLQKRGTEVHEKRL
jgi:hypothetical protein